MQCCSGRADVLLCQRLIHGQDVVRPSSVEIPHQSLLARSRFGHGEHHENDQRGHEERDELHVGIIAFAHRHSLCRPVLPLDIAKGVGTLSSHV